MENQQNLFDLQVDHEVTEYLNQSARWAKLVAIVGLVMSGLFIIFAFFAGAFLTYFASAAGAASGMSGGFLTAIYLVMGLLMILPYLYQYNFATKMQAALRAGDQESFTKAFSNLKSFYKFTGILTIIALSFIALAIVFALIGVAFAAAS